MKNWEKMRENILELPPMQPCKICNGSRPAQYTCPRCEINYCSLTCYRNHGENCSLEFFLNQVASSLNKEETEMNSQTFSHQMRAGVAANPWNPSKSSDHHDDDDDDDDCGTMESGPEEELSRVTDEADEDEDFEREELLKILEKMEEGQIVRLEDLSLNLRVKFLTSFESRELKQPRVMQWVPWWMNNIDVPDVQGKLKPEMHVCCNASPSSSSSAAAAACRRVTVNRRCIFWVIRAMFLYAWVSRRLNGDWDELGGCEFERIVELVMPWMFHGAEPEETLNECLVSIVAIRPSIDMFERAEDDDLESLANIRCLRDALILIKSEWHFKIAIGHLVQLSEVLKNQKLKREFLLRTNFLVSFFHFHVKIILGEEDENHSIKFRAERRQQNQQLQPTASPTHSDHTKDHGGSGGGESISDFLRFTVAHSAAVLISAIQTRLEIRRKELKNNNDNDNDVVRVRLPSSELAD